MGSSLGYTPAERLSYLINHHELSDEVEQEILSIIDDIEASPWADSFEVDRHFIVNKGQMRFDYDY